MSGCGKTEDLSRLTIRLQDGQEIEALICAHGHLPEMDIPMSIGPTIR